MPPKTQPATCQRSIGTAIPARSSSGVIRETSGPAARITTVLTDSASRHRKRRQKRSSCLHFSFCPLPIRKPNSGMPPKAKPTMIMLTIMEIFRTMPMAAILSSPKGRSCRLIIMTHRLEARFVTAAVMPMATMFRAWEPVIRTSGRTVRTLLFRRTTASRNRSLQA